MASVVIHTNMALENQRESAGWLKEGLMRHGLSVSVTPDKKERGDYHVVQGPWYAYSEWFGQPNVLWLDRCFFGDSRFDLSIGWLLEDGTRDFRNKGKTEPNGVLPELKPMKERTGAAACAMVFGDYGLDPKHMIFDARQKYGRVYYRPHPAERHAVSPALQPAWTLEQVWELCDVAVGHSSTALVDAAINGLRVDCPPSYVCYDITDRECWLTRLSWAQWSSEQLKRGEFWEHLNVQSAC